MGHEAFQVNAHARAIKHGKLEGQKQKEEAYKTVRSGVELVFTPDQCQGVERSTKCLNQWLTVVPNAKNNSILGKDEFRDMVLLQYNVYPRTSPSLITACRNKSRDDLGLTVSQAYTPSAIRNDPRVLTCRECSVKGECPESAGPQAPQDLSVQVIKPKDKQKDPNLYGDLLICGLWQAQTDAIINVQINNTDAKSYISKPLESVLAAQEKEKKDKYL
eukprot:14998257-Ditylum_brightwellii.AAC.1